MTNRLISRRRPSRYPDLTKRKELWIVPGAAHVDLYTYAGPEYARRLLAFFAQHLLQ